MSKPISELTYKVVAFSEIQQVDTNDGIDWAIEMLELGYESRTLGMLASIKKPANDFEVIDYVKNAVEELGLKLRNGDDAILSYASYYVNQIVREENIRENLNKLYKFCKSKDYEDLVYDFYLLYWAWDDLDYEDTGNNHYWDGARRNNIGRIVVDEAKKWVEKNRKRYAQV